MCGSLHVQPAFSLVPTPPANAFVSMDRLAETQETFPLELFFCSDCTHLQLLDVVDPTILFEHYVYVSGTSPSFVRHFEEYADSIAAVIGSLAGRLVVDIGSNDGTLLTAFRDRHSAKVLGVDPARNLAEIATAAGVETIADFFTPTLAAAITARHGQAVVITANNVFAHIDDLASVADGVSSLLAPDGIFVFEVSYLLDVVEKTLFDTIYHEHLAYHAVRPLIPFLKRLGLELIEAVRIPSHGGSVRGIAQRAGGPRPRGASVDEALALEAQRGLERLSTYVDMANRIQQLGTELRTLLTGLKSQGKTIAGFGAPAKATTLMYHFGINADLIGFIVDDNPLKQGTFTPGMHIPVLPAESIEQRRPDYLLILAWNFAEPIIAKTAGFRANGGRYIVPLPTVKVV